PLTLCTNVVMNYSEIESKVREATNDDPWGPSGQLMGEIAKSTFMYEQFPEVMNMLWTRMLKDNKKNWRRVYKVFFSRGDQRQDRQHHRRHTQQVQKEGA
uniref:Clathrin interactor 1 n=1 Tax=Takifugu rubripes TaxID=31033 RepID=A0A674NXB8_TAKRU